MYNTDIDFEKLKPQISMLPELLNVVHTESSVRIKEITSIRTICDMMNSASFGKLMFSEVHKLLILYLTAPMTSATAERTFSTLRRLKNNLRANMTQQRLNHIVLLHTHKDYTDKINLTNVAEEFITLNERRIQFFW
jgi:hypothetical protein